MQLQGLVDALSDFQSLPVEQTRYIEGVSATGCFHAGPHYTQLLLEKLGILEAAESFKWMARSMMDDARSGESIPGIICVLCYSLSTQDAGFLAEGRNVFFSETRSDFLEAPAVSNKVVPISGGTMEDKASDLLISVPLAHDRSGHAEFLALRSLIGVAAGISQGNTTEAFKNVTGTVRLYVTHHPCLSCVGAMCQFRAALPNVALEVCYDWEPAAARGH